MQTLNNLNINTAVATGSVPCSLQLAHAGLDAQKPGQTAAYAVLFSPELLCKIITQLPLEAIVVTTGVCHFWRNAVAADPQIQKALSLKPEEVRRVRLYKQCLDEHFERVFSEHGPGGTIPTKYCHTIGNFHPSIEKICGKVHTHRGAPASPITHHPDYFIENEVSTLDVGHTDGNWRNMLVSQPPCKLVKIKIITRLGCFVSHQVLLHKRRKGVRLGKLYDCISLALADELANRRLPKAACVFTRIRLGMYCEADACTLGEHMEVPVRNGVAVFPEELEWEQIPKITFENNWSLR